MREFVRIDASKGMAMWSISPSSVWIQQEKRKVGVV